MCGICGFVKNNGKIENSIIEKMLIPLEHRGPDDKGIFEDNQKSPFCTLGHRRLSIIDLKTGHQPLPDETGRFWCVHNGEVYNFLDLKEKLIQKGYKFRTNSDTEVIANMYHAYGKGCVKKFNGMFSFAIWDKDDRALFLSRDRIGIKPLYYYFDGNSLLFSSSLKSFLALDFIKKDIEPQALSEYLQYLYINAPKSIFKSIKKLEPGSTLLLKNNKIVIEKYWNAVNLIRDNKPSFIRDEEDCINEIKSLLKDSVKMRLISDVPLGIFLSGGVDSSIITALAAKSHNRRVKTFNVTFKGRGYYDESRFARKVSRLFDTEHEEIEICPNLKLDLPKIVDFLDEPFADSSFVPTYYLSDFTRRFVKVALSGTGGDDIFAGYRRYVVDKLINIIDKSPAWIRDSFMAVMNRIIPTRESKIGEKAMLAKRLFSVLKMEKAQRHNMIMSFIDMDMQKELLAADAAKAGSHVVGNAILTEISSRFKDEEYVNMALYSDFMSYLTGDLLKKEDIATMAVGLEGRVPFLDHRLVEYSFRISPLLKVKGLSPKYILKKAFEDMLPKDILYREKHGFAFPISEYLRGDLKDLAQDILFSDIHPFFNRNKVKDYFERHFRGNADLGQHIWALMVFNLWYEKNMK